jgi:hypothetical protein
MKTLILIKYSRIILLLFNNIGTRFDICKKPPASIDITTQRDLLIIVETIFYIFRVTYLKT